MRTERIPDGKTCVVGSPHNFDCPFRDRIYWHCTLYGEPLPHSGDEELLMDMLLEVPSRLPQCKTDYPYGGTVEIKAKGKEGE